MADALSASFKPGDSVLVRVGSPPRHIRTPAFIQGKTGRVERLYGAFPDPETLAYGATYAERVPLYRVRFDQADVWKRYAGRPGDSICVDIYQHWLEPADAEEKR